MTDATDVTRDATPEPVSRSRDGAASGVRNLTPVRRFVLSLALVPIVPGLTGIIVEMLGGWTPPVGTWDNERIINLVLSSLWFVGVLAIWRTLVVWTLGRAALTTIVSMIPFAQIVYAQPLWDAGCIADSFLRHAQNFIGIGTWLWFLVWIWWLWERRGQNVRKSSSSSEAPAERISADTGRLVAGLGTLPVVIGVFVMCAIWVDDALDSYEISTTYSICAVVAVTLWILIWRKRVRRSHGSLRRMLVAALIIMGLPLALAWYMEPSGPTGITGAVTFSLPVIGWGVWMWFSLAVAVPRQVWDIHHAAPTCPGCGYNLNGLTTTRCPECGQEPTLDELWSIRDTA